MQRKHIPCGFPSDKFHVTPPVNVTSALLIKWFIFLFSLKIITEFSVSIYFHYFFNYKFKVMFGSVCSGLENHATVCLKMH